MISSLIETSKHKRRHRWQFSTFGLDRQKMWGLNPACDRDPRRFKPTRLSLPLGVCISPKLNVVKTSWDELRCKKDIMPTFSWPIKFNSLNLERTVDTWPNRWDFIGFHWSRGWSVSLQSLNRAHQDLTWEASNQKGATAASQLVARLAHVARLVLRPRFRNPKKNVSSDMSASGNVSRWLFSS